MSKPKNSVGANFEQHPPHIVGPSALPFTMVSAVIGLIATDVAKTKQSKSTTNAYSSDISASLSYTLFGLSMEWSDWLLLGLTVFVGAALIVQKVGPRIKADMLSLHAGWKNAPNRLKWFGEVSFGLLMVAANPFRGIMWIVIFLSRNLLGVTPYFAWFFFFNLIIFTVGGTLNQMGGSA